MRRIVTKPSTVWNARWICSSSRACVRLFPCIVRSLLRRNSEPGISTRSFSKTCSIPKYAPSKWPEMIALPRLYAIADAQFGNPVEIAGRLFEGGARLVQVRNKTAGAGVLMRQVEEVLQI